MILWLILTLAVLAQCEQPGCPDSCSCSFWPKTSVRVECNHISLAHFNMNSLPPNTTALSIQFSDLTNLSSTHLSSLPFLTKLKLHHNNLTILPADLLHGIPLLHTLDLTENHLSHLPHRIFALESLRVLVLKNNLFQQVDPEWFPLISKVTSLDLSSNYLTNFPPPEFLQRLPYLENLNLSHNPFRVLREDILRDLQNLKVLKLMHNGLTDLKPATFTLNPKLVSSIQQDDQPHGLPHLHTIDLTGNKLSRLPPGIFALESLQNVLLKNNLIEEVDPDWFLFNSNVTWLNLAQNVLSSIPRAVFQRLPRLENLDLSFNRLNELREDTLKDLPQLQVVNLMENRLTALQSETFRHNPKLVYMVLNQNQLQELPGNLTTGLTELRFLFINQNQLRNLPEGLLEDKAFLFQIFLQGNPWQCDENLKYLWKWMKNNSHKVHFRSEVVCDGPAKLRNSQILLLTENELKP